MSINLFTFSTQHQYIEILSIKIGYFKERAFFYIDKGHLEFLFFNVY